MYKIFADGEIIHNPALNDDTRLVVDAKISQKVNMADALEFTIYPSNAGAASIHKLTTTIEVYQDDLLLFRGRPIQSKTGWENQTTYTCEGGLAVLNDTIVRPYSFTGSVRDYLQQLITQHNNQVPAAKQITLRNVTVTDPNNTIVRSNSDYVTTMQEIQDKLVENLGGYLMLSYDAQTGWILDYLAASPRATGQAITLAKNLLDMLREQNAENIATALIPLGAVDEATGERITIRTVNGGQDYIVDQTAAARYGLIFTTETWNDVTIPANLLRKAQARLTDYATMIPTIKLTAVDLSAIDSDLDPIRILDEVTVQDDKHEASGVYLVAERTYDLSAPERDTVTFGGDLPSITKASAKTAAAVQDIPAQILQTASDRTRAILDAATDGAIQILYNQDGVAYELRINNSQNPATATKWWRYNSAGWGYTADGGQTYTIAATMDGAFLANIISSGILQSREGNNPKFYLNLDTGELRGNFSSLSIQSDSVATQGYANAEAAAAQSAAEATAAADATSKANAAQTAAINAAATDATTKADAAQSAAEATAAADATAKANAAEASAVSTAASNTNAAISNYDSSLDQQAVFNKLTNNQANQGIYIQDGQVYVNASMILAGILAGIEINNGNGTFRVDENGNVTANSLSSSNATITGGSIDVSRNETRASTAFNILSRFLRIINTYDNGETDINAGSARFYTPNNNNNELIILANSISASTGVGLLSWMINSGGISFMSGNTLVSYPASGISSISGNATKGSIRFKQGKVQIAWNTVTWTGKLNHAWGSGIYESASVISLGDWKQSFNAAPSVAYSANSGGNLTAWVAAGTSPPSVSSAGSIVLERVNSSDAQQTWTVRAIAVGTYS